MSEWKEVKLGMLGNIITGKTPRTAIEDNYGGTIPFLTPSDDMSVKHVVFTKKTLSEKLVTLKDEEDKLNSDIKKLKDPEYVARYAREKYMYSKDGELIIRLPDDDTDK